MKNWLKVLIGLILVIGIIFAFYYFFFSEETKKDFESFDAPKRISNYELTAFKNLGKSCSWLYEETENEKDQLCEETVRVEYYYNKSDNIEGVYVSLLIIPQNRRVYLKERHKLIDKNEISDGVYNKSSEKKRQ